ncbi:helix-turn-helix transcriptional regulator [Arthrobacter sp. H-02-3]|uniref:helix-turn-helix transcriptional regulator n=1 Tax=Arthrobacter sp. H-02-3 TaxID=2703675 RepID=UPI000DD1B0E9|nr:LuxR family transcriptional regulator [Arthrobacter sp. H-02-3]PVZ57105.1 LuxR family transcriptional regulator [Arthrobacter sp. H-02-3]
MVLFGRTKEIDRVLALIRSPRESAMTVTGGHGSGKSSLLAEIPKLHEYRSVLFRANPSESSWPFSGLTALLNGIDDPALAPLTDYVATSPRGNLDAADISTMLLSALRQWSADRTVVVIDDAEQLDPASQTVLGFLARRLAGTGLVLIASMRGEAPESPFARLATLQLENLSLSDAVRMLEAITPGVGSTAVIHAVATATHGNPLASINLYNQLIRRQLQGQYALPVPLHWNGSFESDLAASISAFSPRGRRALDLLSLSYRSSAALLEEMPGDLWAGVDEIVSAGIAVRTGSHLSIQNQMLRAHVFSAMQPAERTAYHHALAAVAEKADRLAWPWHLSYTPAVRRDTSFTLLRHAIELVRAEETQSAVEYIERALTINPWEAETAARLGTIAEVLFSRGEFVHSKRYLDWAQRITKNRALTLRLTGLDFQMELMKGNSVRPSMMLRLIKEFGHHDPGFSACLLSIGALHMAERWQVEDAEQLLEYAEHFLGEASGEALAVNQRARLLAGAVKGSVDQISRAADGGAHSSPASLLLKGRALTYAENYEGARDLFSLVRNLSVASDANWSETARYFAADNEIRAGNFRSAIALIDEIASSATSQQYHRGMCNNFLLWRAYSVGDLVAARDCLAPAQEFVSADVPPPAAAQLFACQGHFALMRGDLEEACTFLSRAVEIGVGFGNPALLRCEADLVEVLVRTGHRREAARVLTGMEYRAAGLRSRWLRMAISRSRALVAEGDHSLELFVQALNSWQKDDSLFERARTLLCYAERLETSGRHKDARNALLKSKALFEEAGAASWTQAVDAMLLGDHLRDVPEIHGPALPLLSDQERELVQLVARGRRNKEIAASLFVSVRTVEVRLTAIYRKLGVQSRSQLTCLVSTGGTVPLPELAREPSILAV